MMLIGVRQETKNAWERRTPLTPDHVQELVRGHGIGVRVEASPRRVFPDGAYAEAGALVTPSLSDCRVILGVKEIPADQVEPGRVYVVFSHTTKGQAENLPTLKRMAELGCTLLDYELIVDRRGRRVVFFGRHAGYAGMLDTLRALGLRLALEGLETPLAQVRMAHAYADLPEAMDHLGHLGEAIRRHGLPSGLRPVVVGFMGSGNVAQGALEVFNRLPFEDVEPEDLLKLSEDRDRPRNLLFRTRFDRATRVRRASDGGFDAAELAAHPDRYESALGPFLPHLTALVNGTFWAPGQPPLVTREQLRALWTLEPQPKLRVLGDITCDIDGGIQATVRATDPGDPFFTYDPFSGAAPSGVEGRGPVVMAVDNLPCELPADASEHFGDALLRFVPALARCDWDRPLEDLPLPQELRQAVILHQGRLAPRFRYLEAL